MLTLLFFSMLTCNVLGKVCNIYEVSTTNPSTISLQGESIGLYKVNHEKNCYGRPTFKHALQDLYLYVSDAGIWIIGGANSYKSCFNSGYLYKLDKPAPVVPNSYGWLYLNWITNIWHKDPHMKVTCLCHLIQITTKNHDTRIEQPDILGLYVINKEHKCRNRPTYKHVRNNRYIFVDNTNRWVISNANNHISCSNTDINLNPVINAYNPSRPALKIPGKTRWRYYDQYFHKWRNDTTMNANCIMGNHMDTMYKY